MTMPVQNRGRSEQSYRTPPEFLAAVSRRFGEIAWDLAASEENSVCGQYSCYTAKDDALKRNWQIEGLLWCNPPFENIDPWAVKCRAEAAQGARILLLTPASVGADWFAESVHRHALVLGLSPRIKFVGETHGYPKDLVLSAFGFGVGFDTWRWNGKARRARK